MYNATIPGHKVFQYMLTQIESLYFLVNEIEHHYDHYPKHEMELPLRTALSQLLSVVNPSFASQTEAMKVMCYDDSFQRIDQWIQNGGMASIDFTNNSPEFISLYDYFEHALWKKRKFFKITKSKQIYNSRLYVIAVHLRLYAETKQLERELQRHSITYETDLAFQSLILYSVECWIHVENKKHRWTKETEDEILELLCQEGTLFFVEYVDFLPRSEQADMFFLEIATEFIRKADELTLEFRV